MSERVMNFSGAFTKKHLFEIIQVQSYFHRSQIIYSLFAVLLFTARWKLHELNERYSNWGLRNKIKN